MYNRYTCPLQPCTHLTLKLLIQGHPQSAEVAHIADFKSAYTSLIIKAATILRLLGNKMIQSNTLVKKSEPGLRKQLKIDIKSNSKIRFFFKNMNIFVYFTNIRCFHFPFLYFKHLQTLNFRITMFL